VSAIPGQDIASEFQRSPAVAGNLGALVSSVLALLLLVTAPERGERLFQTDCASCHGPRGEGGIGAPLAVPRLSRARDMAALVKIISGGIEGTEMQGARRTAMEIAALAAWVGKLGERPPEPLPGNAKRGAALYAGKGTCTTCHSIAGRGGALGADLTEVGLRRGASYLRTALLQPEAAVPRAYASYRNDVSLTENFLQVRVVTAKGAELTGVRVNEDTFSIQLRDATNKVHSFWKTELRQLHKDWGRSPMPSYAEVFTPAELDDLVAFLATQRGEQNDAD
jgi:putative heme-binding domain-containing protein